MKKIPLTQGQFAIVDDEDFYRFGHFKWQAHWAPNTRSFYAVRTSYPSPGIKKYHSLHRDVMGVIVSRVKVDHKNHNTLDCRRRTNLRVCTSLQNGANRKGANKNSSTKMRGVSWKKSHGIFIAQIGVSGNRIHLGCFGTAKKASQAYNAARLEHFGEFAGKS